MGKDLVLGIDWRVSRGWEGSGVGVGAVRWRGRGGRGVLRRLLYVSLSSLNGMGTDRIVYTERTVLGVQSQCPSTDSIVLPLLSRFSSCSSPSFDRLYRSHQTCTEVPRVRAWRTETERSRRVVVGVSKIGRSGDEDAGLSRLSAVVMHASSIA